MTRQEFQQLTKTVLLVDGATGSNLMAMGMPRGVCTEAWVLDHKDVLQALQRAYLEAGSRVIYAPTFGANRFNLAKHGLEGKIREMNLTLAGYSQEVAKAFLSESEVLEGSVHENPTPAADSTGREKTLRKKVYVAGDISPTGGMMQPMGDMTYEKAFEIYQEQVRYLVEAGVDMIAVETMYQIEETMAAIDAVHSVCDLPVLCTVTVDADGSIFTGGNATEAAVSFEATGADAVGVNCSVGPDQLVSIIRNIRENVSVPVIAKPNAGMPQIDDAGNAFYSMDAKTFAGYMKALVDAGAGIIGGCCGTTPEYIRQMAKLLR
ncbi:MAG: homocysteine S-methyltransferase family protein [Lachnospiraceae bacterium]|nr:homocysteine S-methyltransferase family protein [Lachnospiraceae bacterium]